MARSHSRRTQFMKRIPEFVDEYQTSVRLAYYPPYHYKYNPVVRVWGILEQHWNGHLLDTVNTAFQLVETMKWKNKTPQTVKLINKNYQTGIKLEPREKNQLEPRFQRLKNLEKYF